MSSNAGGIKSILIGKGRRITLDELLGVCCHDGFELEWFDAVASEEESTVEACSITIENDTNEGILLTHSESLAVLTLLALNVAQGKWFPKDQAKSSQAISMGLINLVNQSRKTKSSTDDSSGLRLPCDSTACLLSLRQGMKESGDEFTIPIHVMQRILWLAPLSLSTIRASWICKTIALPIAAMSVERFQKCCMEFYAEHKFDIGRPHRGLIAAAALLRALLHGSRYVLNEIPKDDVPKALKDIPQYHGPAQDGLTAACKTLELECNCFEQSADDMLDDTVASMAELQARSAVERLHKAGLARMQVENTEAAASPTATASPLGPLVAAWLESLTTEARLGFQFAQDETDRIAEETRQKEAEKEARAAQHATAGGDANDEFAGMTEAQKAKILKKRAEKEAKAAAKKKAKQTKGKSPFGTGTSQMAKILFADSSKLLDSQRVLEQTQVMLEQLLSGGVQRKPKLAKGTRDYLPEQMSIRQEAFSIIRRVFETHGAVEIDTPVFELKETLTGKYGEDSKLIFDLADQGGELLALRYDLTVPFARFLALHSVGHIKRFHIGKVYRRDQPALSRGRYREFYQCDFDIAGVYSPMVPDAECLAVVCDILHALPIGDFGVKLNHRKLLDAILDLCGVPAEKFRTICSAVDKLDKEPWSEVKHEMIHDKGLSEEVADKIGTFVLFKGEPRKLHKELMDSNRFGKHVGANKAMDELNLLFDYLEAMDKLKFISFDLSLARGLDYYTGVIYEAVCMSGNTQVGSIGGGGRYDYLVSMFQESGKEMPCVGVSVGIERVFTLMEARVKEEREAAAAAKGSNPSSLKDANVDILVASVGDGMMKERMKIARLLWDAKLRAEFSPQESAKVKFELRNALDRNIPFMVIVGEDELKTASCKLKDLNAKTEDTIPIAELVQTLRKKGVIPVGCEFAAEWLQQEKEAQQASSAQTTDGAAAATAAAGTAEE